MLRAQYPKGTRVELVHTSDPYTKLQPGTKGTVEFVDDAGTIQISWDNGSGLGMIPGEDEVVRHPGSGLKPLLLAHLVRLDSRHELAHRVLHAFKPQRGPVIHMPR